MTWEKGYLECAWVPVYEYAMPWPLFYFLIIGVPIIFVLCCCASAFYWLSSRQIAISKKLQTDIEGYVAGYERENDGFGIETTEINADLCMPIVGEVIDDDSADDALDPLPVSDTEVGQAGHYLETMRRNHGQSAGTAPRPYAVIPHSGADGISSEEQALNEGDRDGGPYVGAPSRFLRMMASGNAVSNDARSSGHDLRDEDWRAYLVNTALNRRLRGVNDARQHGPRKFGDGTEEAGAAGADGDEVAV